jgi:HPt (histidine-containing phosphotransfer) domain-containing protein
MSAATGPPDDLGVARSFERYAETPTLDRELFDRHRIDLGDAAMSSLVMLFSERAPQLRALGRAARGQDGKEVARIAHSLLGGAGILAAKKLAEYAMELERRGLGELGDDAPALANEATMEFERAVSVMRAQLAVPAKVPVPESSELSPAG